MVTTITVRVTDYGLLIEREIGRADLVGYKLYVYTISKTSPSYRAYCDLLAIKP